MKILDSIVVQEDVGGPYPEYKKVRLNLWDSGRVTWEMLTDGPDQIKLDQEIERLLRE